MLQFTLNFKLIQQTRCKQKQFKSKFDTNRTTFDVAIYSNFVGTLKHNKK